MGSNFQDTHVYFNVVGRGWGASEPDVGAETLMFILTLWGGDGAHPDVRVETLMFILTSWGGAASGPDVQSRP